MRPLIFLVALLTIAQSASALTYFGPGTALDCKGGPLVFGVSDYYLWNPGAGTMTGGGLAGPCITIDADDVVLDCDTGIGQGNIDGQIADVSGIVIAAGRSNITIINCRVLDFFASNIYIDGTTKDISDIKIINTTLTYDNPLKADADNIACINADRITFDGVTAITKAAHGVHQSGLGNGAAGFSSCSNTLIINSNFDDNTDYGVYLMADNFTAENSYFDNNGNEGARIWGENTYLSGNSFSNNGGNGILLDIAPNAQILSNVMDLNNNDGMRMYEATSAYIYDNNITNSSAAAIYAQDSMNSVFESNNIENNPKAGMFFFLNLFKSNDNLTILSNSVVNTDLGVQFDELTNSEIRDNTISTVVGEGILINTMSGSDFIDNTISDCGGKGIEANDLDQVNFYNNTIVRSGEEGIRIEGTSDPDTLIDGDVYINNTEYAIYMDAPGLLTVDNTMIYGVITQYLYVSGTAEFDSHYLWLGFDDTFGIEWPNVKFLASATDITDKNLILDNDFVSMDSADPNIDEFDEMANITVEVPGCTLIRYYTLVGFPTTQADIIQNGIQFAPVFSQCAGTVATFQVAGFSGYAANGTIPVPPGSGSGGGDDDKDLSVSMDVLCPDDMVQFTVTYQGEPVSNVEVELTQYEPYAGLISTDYTGDSGTVQFGISSDAVYRARITKDGYEYMNPYSFDYTMCEEEEPVQLQEEEPEEQPTEEPEPSSPPEEEIIEEPEEVPEEISEEIPEEQPEIIAEPEIPEEVPKEQEEELPCLLPIAILAIAAVGAVAYYWFVMRKTKR